MPPGRWHGAIMRGLGIWLVLLALPAAGRAQEGLDPAAFALPDLSGSGAADVVANGWKYFVFRKDGVRFEQAHADMADCFRFLQPTGWANVKLPRFVPWRQATPTQTVALSSPYGLVGDLMLAAVEGTLVRRDRQSRMRRCLEPRGYVRYGIAEPIWASIYKMPPAQAIGTMARIASGPDFGGKVPEK